MAVDLELARPSGGRLLDNTGHQSRTGGRVVIVAIDIDGRAYLPNLPDLFLNPWHSRLDSGSWCWFWLNG